MMYRPAPGLALLAQGDNTWIWIAGILVFVFFILAIILFRYLNLWIQAHFSNAGITLLELMRMRLRNADPKVILKAKIAAVQSGVDVATSELEAHYR